MKPAKLIVLGVAGTAALAAAWLTSSLRTPQVIVKAQDSPAPTIAMTEVLIAAVDLPVGSSVTGEQLKWQPWPKQAVSELMITRDRMPNGVEDTAGSISRAPSLAGEPIRRDKMIKGVNGGFMSAVLPTGKRAVAINIVSSGARSAGGFILPNDRVDIMRTARDDDATKSRQAETFATETLLQNIRVLAIGQNVQERNGEKVVVGETATLELEPRQAELVMMAQRSGELSLALRSLADTNKTDEAPQQARDDTSLTIVRYGNAQNVGKR
jgi:pilus assembly protein CpaB